MLRHAFLLAACAAVALSRAADPSVVEGPSGYNCWPMVQTVSNRLVCVYTCGKVHDPGERGRGTYARVSCDGGRTWGARICVAQNPVGALTPVAKGLDMDGAALFWVRAFGSGLPRHTLYRTVDGICFDKVATLDAKPLPMQITDVFHVEGVGLMALWFGGSYYDDEKPRWWGVVTSADNGKTWRQRICGAGMRLADWPTEPSVAVLRDGRLLAVARTELRGRPLFQMTSTDRGETWEVVPTNIGDVFKSTPSLVYDARTNRVTLYYYQRERGVLRRRTADADRIFGASAAWPESEELVCDHGHSIDAGNANAVFSGGVHYVSWYAGKAPDCSVKVLGVKPKEIN